jgi:hypothetical protein
MTVHTLTRSSEAGWVLRNDTFKPPLDFSRAPRRLNILCTASVRTAEQNLKRDPYDGAAAGSKHALAESFKPILSAKGRFVGAFFGGETGRDTNPHTLVSASGGAPSVKWSICHQSHMGGR